MTVDAKKVCPLLGNPCVEGMCAWYTKWNDKGMCSVVRLVQFANSKDVSNAEKERLRNMMKEKWYG